MPKEKALIMNRQSVDRALTRIAHEIVERNKGTENLAFIGIRTCGVHLAHRLASKIQNIEGVDVPVGVLDVTFYRDDISTMKSGAAPVQWPPMRLRRPFALSQSASSTMSARAWSIPTWCASSGPSRAPTRTSR